MPKFLIDCSTYTMNNIGDKAMLLTMVGRLKKFWNDARFYILTNDPQGIRDLVPDAHPIVVGNRKSWLMFAGVHQLEPLYGRLWDFEAECRRLRSDEVASRLEKRVDPVTASGFREFHRIIREADCVLTTGGGFFSDNFADHAVGILQTLEEGLYQRKPVFMMGVGFEPVEHPLLLKKAREVLPRLSLIGCRESLTAPEVLRGFGVSEEKIVVGGDDAIELAHVARANTPGKGIGINLRVAAYAGTTEQSGDRIRRAVYDAAHHCNAALVPIPISIDQPSDPLAIQDLLRDFDDPTDGGITLTTPNQLFAQLRTCRVMVTGSYHGAVFALAQGIPTIALVDSLHYRVKMTGLMDQFGGTVLRFDDPELANKLRETIVDLWHRADELRPHLLKAAQQQIAASHAAYDKLYQTVQRSAEISERASDLSYEEKGQNSSERLDILFSLSDAMHELAEQVDFYRYHADERLKVITQLTEQVEIYRARIERHSNIAKRLRAVPGSRFMWKLGKKVGRAMRSAKSM